MRASLKTIRLATLSLTVGLLAAAAPLWAKDPTTVPADTTPATRPTTVTAATPEQEAVTGTETVVFLRHGEKPPRGLGQLTPQGLNRALALSTVLPAKFGKPDFLFAPDPSLTKVAEGGSAFFYCRPLATLEPTAIALGMPVQTPFGFAQIDRLNAELTKPKYARAVIFVAWEHGYEQKAAASLVQQFAGDGGQVPRWPGNDYDSLYVVTIRHVAGRPATVAFRHDHEGLDHLSREMPVPSSAQP